MSAQSNLISARLARRREAFATGFLDGFGALARLSSVAMPRIALRQPLSPSRDRQMIRGDFSRAVRSLREQPERS